MVGWHHPLNRHDFEQTLGDSGGQRNLALQSMGWQRAGHERVTTQGGNVGWRNMYTYLLERISL